MEYLILVFPVITLIVVTIMGILTHKETKRLEATNARIDQLIK